MVHPSAIHSSKLLLCQKHLIFNLPFKLFQKKKNACEFIFLSYDTDLVKDKVTFFFKFELNIGVAQEF